jgi:hypothetical protein
MYYILHTCYTPRPYSPSWFQHLNNILKNNTDCVPPCYSFYNSLTRGDNQTRAYCQFRFVSFRFFSFLFVSFRFVSFLFVSFRSPYFFCLLTAGVEVVYFHLITPRHTPQWVGLLWIRDRPVTETSTWQHKHCTRKTSMSPVGFEPMIPTNARPQTYALDRAATGIGPTASCDAK